MRLLLTSPSALCIDGEPNREIVKQFANLIQEGHRVAVLSNSSEPGWFKEVCEGTGLIFHRWTGRQRAKTIPLIAKQLKVDARDILVLSSNLTDVQMAKNGGAVLLGSDWSSDEDVRQTGIRVPSPKILVDVIRMYDAWHPGWWYVADCGQYHVRALGDLSTMYKDDDQIAFAKQLTNTVKQGGPQLIALMALTAHSALFDSEIASSRTMWGVYPSSDSDNDDQETLSDFAHRLRHTLSSDRFCERGEPLFIRHKASTKRSKTKNTNRTDPTEQLQTIRLNPHYGKQRLRGRNVVLFDDCTTYGVSFGVAAALLRRAGARSIVCIALGKFGNQTRGYDINVTGDPWQPLGDDDYEVQQIVSPTEATDKQAQFALRELLA